MNIIKKNIHKKIGVFVFLLTTSLVYAQKGYEIQVQVDGLSDTTLLLGHYFNKSMYPDDTIYVDKSGSGVFRGNTKLPGGMYILFLPNKKYVDFMMDEDQHFSMTTDTSDLFGNMKFSGNELANKFLDYQLFLVEKSSQRKELNQMKGSEASDAEKEKIDARMKALDKEVKNFIDNVIDENKDNFLGVFVNATQRVEVPDPPRDEEGNITDSSFQYRYYRNHFFDNFDVSDPRLLRTPLYEDMVLNYINKVIPQIPDTLIKEVDWLIEQSRSSEELFRYMLITLFNTYAKSKIMGMDAVYLHIAEKYYIPEATWSDQKFINELKERVEKAKPSLLGKVAPDFQLVELPMNHLLQAAGDTALKRNPYVGQMYKMHDIQAKYLVLAFWESDCGHCKKEIPALYSLFQDDLKSLGVKVLAMHMLGGEEGKEKWIDFLNEHELYEWINAWNPYDYEYKKLYDLYSTPVLFLLDKDKKIIAKRVGAEQIEEIIQAREKFNN